MKGAFLAAAALLFGTAIIPGQEASPATSEVTPEALEFFEKKVRPVLSERCYQCHSAQSEKLKAGLLVDSRAGLLKGGDTGPAIVPGDAENSLLIKAVRYDSDLQMPPKQKLTQAEIESLTTWVAQGAPWPGGDTGKTAKLEIFDLHKRRSEHWSWQPINAPPAPEVRQSEWPVNPIDRFVLAKLEATGLKPAGEADKRTLIRRVYFDLIGLPPSTAEVAAFLADTDEKAYENLVERLLHSPQYGERWARHWLDLVRYSETLGHEFDYYNFNAWRYRDYVIRAINADVPHDQLILEHVAGDLLERPRRHPTEGFNESVIGTGFYWMGQRVHSPVDVRLEQTEVVDNQIDVTAKAFMGLTVACARCHDHKFDAISTRDYYSLFGVLGSSRYTQASIDPPEVIQRVAEQLAKKKADLRPLIGRMWQEQATNMALYFAAAAEVGFDKSGADLSNRTYSVAVRHQLDRSRLESWSLALRDPAVTHAEGALRAWRKMVEIGGKGSESGFAEDWNREMELQREARANQKASIAATAIDFTGVDFGGWFVEDEGFGESPTSAGDFVVGDTNRPVVAVIPQKAANSSSIARRFEGVLRSPTFVITNQFIHVLAAGAGTRLNVRVANFTMIRDPIYGGLKRYFDNHRLHWTTLDVGTWKGLRAYLEFNDQVVPDPSDEADKRFSNDAYVAISRVVFSEDPAPPRMGNAAVSEGAKGLNGIKSLGEGAAVFQKTVMSAIEGWAAGRVDEPDAELISWLNRYSLLDSSADSPAARDLITAVAEFRAVEVTLPDRVRVLAMVDGNGLDEYVFIRGNHKNAGEVVPRRFLEALGGSDQAPYIKGSGRLELARQIIDPSNPFTARVMVNRTWQHVFGRGIVPTPDDFGVLGQAPSHPELLDWLARWYQTEAAWSNRKLLKLLVTSRTYRMSSQPSDPIAEEKDPQNISLHRMNIRRLQSEPIRDALLAVSGQLDLSMFGPPVPVHLTEFMDGRGRPAQSGPLDGGKRRSLYQEVRRNFLPPIMRAFDFPVPFTTIGRRTVSNVPAQSLILMNDPFVVGQAEAWAKSILAVEGATPKQRIQQMYETILSRPPSELEVSAAQRFLKTQGEAYGIPEAERVSNLALWTDLCHVMMNLKEFVFLN